MITKKHLGAALFGVAFLAAVWALHFAVQGDPWWFTTGTMR